MGWCGTLFIEFINASLGTRVMPGGKRKRERERESGYETAICVSALPRAEVKQLQLYQLVVQSHTVNCKYSERDLHWSHLV